jgi:hypothetical protein
MRNRRWSPDHIDVTAYDISLKRVRCAVCDDLLEAHAQVDDERSGHILFECGPGQWVTATRALDLTQTELYGDEIGDET